MLHYREAKKEGYHLSILNKQYKHERSKIQDMERHVRRLRSIAVGRILGLGIND